jgi:CheY-like chemotaxis protein
MQEGRLKNFISVVRDGAEAVDFLEQRGDYATVSLPDLILLDVNLPRMNGHEVVRYIKSEEHLRHIPVVILTTSSSPSDVHESYKNHANCFITKPVDIHEFIKVVTTIENFFLSIVKLPPKI